MSPTQITLLFNEGFTKPRDRVLFGIYLYAATTIKVACTLLRGDVIGIKSVRDILVIRNYNTKGKQETRGAIRSLETYINRGMSDISKVTFIGRVRTCNPLEMITK